MRYNSMACSILLLYLLLNVFFYRPCRFSTATLGRGIRSIGAGSDCGWRASPRRGTFMTVLQNKRRNKTDRFLCLCSGMWGSLLSALILDVYIGQLHAYRVSQPTCIWRMFEIVFISDLPSFVWFVLCGSHYSVDGFLGQVKSVECVCFELQHGSSAAQCYLMPPQVSALLCGN